MPEEVRLDQRPEDSMSTELCENVSRIDFFWNVEEPQNISVNLSMNMLIGSCIIAQGGIQDIRAGDDTCIIMSWSTEDVGSSIGHMIHDLSSGQSSSNKFRTVCCGCNTSLWFTEPIDRSGVDQMKDGCDGTTSSKILREVGLQEYA